jgi:pyruvate/2-oxoglutarate dehydrogenase complex dihydrolipoamide acyltransferase (E2) component
MRLFQKLLVLPLTILMAISSSAFAQQHAVDPGALATAVTQHIATQDADRAAVRDALAQPQVREIAAQMGVDLEKANAAVDTMTGTDLTRAATTARQLNGSLVGGASTIVISTTTIIIALLVLILIVIAVK